MAEPSVRGVRLPEVRGGTRYRAAHELSDRDVIALFVTGRSRGGLRLALRRLLRGS